VRLKALCAFLGYSLKGSETLEKKGVQRLVKRAGFNKELFSAAKEFFWPFSRSYQYID